MGLVQEGGIFRIIKFPTGILLEKDSSRLRGTRSFLKNSDGLFSLSQMKHLQKFGRCDYKDNSRIILNKLFSCKMMSEINLKGNDKKIVITDTEMLKVVVGKLIVYENI